MTDATITLSEVSVYGNCMPVVAPDPIIAVWTVTVSGAAGSTATLVDAKLTISGAAATVTQTLTVDMPTVDLTDVTQTLTVDMPTVDLTDGSGSQMQRKEDADGGPTGACSGLCTGATFSLELSYEVDGVMVSVTETGNYSCVY